MIEIQGKKLVIDSSAAISYILKEKGWKDIEKVLLEYDFLFSTKLLIKESLNAIWKRKYLIKDLENDKEVIRRLFLLTKIINFYKQSKLYKKAYKISSKYNITIYDSLFLALALKIRGDLLTRDKKQAEVGKKLGIEVIVM